MKPVLFLMTFYCATNLWAQSSVVPFDKLRSLYNSAAAPRSHEVVVAALNKSTNCVQASSQMPGYLDNLNSITVLTTVTPGNGPEFPPVTYNAIAAIENYAKNYASARDISDTYRFVLTAQELQIETYKLTHEYDCPPRSDECIDDVERTAIKLNIKLSTNYVHYQIGNDIYGYCWKP